MKCIESAANHLLFPASGLRAVRWGVGTVATICLAVSASATFGQQTPTNQPPAPGELGELQFQQSANPVANAPRQPSTAAPRTQSPRRPAAAAPAASGAPPRVATGPRPAPRPAAAPPAAIPAPFELTPQEQADLDRLLVDWERKSEQIKLFKCDFKRWEYDNVFNKRTVGLGELKYRSPDRGNYRVADEKTGESIEHWICDGNAIFELNAEKKQVIERVLPEHMRGKAIADGPLPFIFGAKAATLKQRYWMRLKRAPAGQESKICLEAFPKLQQDAANFQRAELLLDPQGLTPFALQLDLPNGKNITVHQFYNTKTSDPLDGIKDFLMPRVPTGWTHLVEQPETVPAEPAPPAPGPAPSARPASRQAGATAPAAPRQAGVPATAAPPRQR